MKINRNFQHHLPNDSRSAVVVELQATLQDLIMMSLQAKQLHWAVTGPDFRSTHELMDEIAHEAQAFADEVAERTAALGAVPDGRLAGLYAASPLPQVRVGFVPSPEVISITANRLKSLSGRLRNRISRVAEVDPVSEDLLLNLLYKLEKRSWMVQARQLDKPRPKRGEAMMTEVHA